MLFIDFKNDTMLLKIETVSQGKIYFFIFLFFYCTDTSIHYYLPWSLVFQTSPEWKDVM